MENETFDGGCTCGHVRYRMTSRPLIVHGCHCRLCQRQSGTSFAQNALIEADRVQLLEGKVKEDLVETPSGSGQKIARCPKCHVAVWSNYLTFSGVLGAAVNFIRVGTLDNPDSMPPDVHIYTSTKQPWLTLPAGALFVDEYYNTRETWSEDSLKRREVLLNAVKD